MASKSLNVVSRRIYVIDTSYLLDLFKIPVGSSQKKTINEKASFEITDRFKQVLDDQHQLFVPLPCIFELGNHLAKVGDGGLRKQLAIKLLDTIKSCIKDSIPWTITPATGINFLSDLFEDFAITEKYVDQQIGLVDAFTIHEARRLKEQNKHKKVQVHIWTKDKDLKAREPDTEANPFVG